MHTHRQTRRARRRSFIVAAAVAASSSGWCAALAADITWVGPAGSPAAFSIGANWSGGAVPDSADNAFINNGGIATVAAGFERNITDLKLGTIPAGIGSLIVSGGTLNASGRVSFGANQSGAGALNISSGALIVGADIFGDLDIGDDGAGTATISGGLLSTRFLYLGHSTHGHGHITQTGGSVSATRNLVMAELKPADTSAPQTASDYTISGGSLTVGGEMYVGAHGPATFSLGGGGTVSVVGAVHIGASGGFLDPPAGLGTFNMSGGAMTVTGNNAHFVIADHGDGTFNLSGGSLTTKYYNTGQNFEPGFSTRGVVNQSGGTATAQYAWVVGQDSRSENLYDLSGGTVTVVGAGPDTSVPGDLNVAGGAGSHGTLRVRGSGVANVGNSALIGNAPFTAGTLAVSDNGALRLGLNGAGSGELIVGIDGSGNLQLSGGGSIIADSMTLGQNASAVGTGTQSGGSLLVHNNMSVGEASANANVYSITAGTLSVGSGLFVGSSGAGTFALGGSGNVSANTITNALTGAGAINVSGGTLAATAFENHGAYAQSGGVASVGPVTSSGQVTVSGGTLTAASIAQGSLIISAAGRVVVAPNGTESALSIVGNLSLSGAAVLDLNDNDMIASAGMSKTAIATSIRTARAGGAWTANGITSSSAKTQTNHATTLGVLSGAEFHGVAGPTATFDGAAVADSDVLVKYTWYGDTDFNGVVNFDDYVRTDNGFNNHLAGWLNGDFDLNDVVNFDDYVLIDLAFNTQSGTLRRAMSYLDGADRSLSGMDEPALQKVVEHASEFGSDYSAHFLSAVPEPGALILIGVPALAGMSRRTRRRV